MGNGGPTVCEWCGGRIEQPATGRRRLYCGRTHRELAYRERKTQRRIGEAVDQAAALDSSVVETRARPSVS
jgi:hypothetical protein